MSKPVRVLSLFVLVALLTSALAWNASAQEEQVEIDFYFPEATANNAQAIFEEYAAQFQELYPNITVNVAYQGSYTDNRTKIQTEVQAGEGPDVAVMLATDLFSFLDEGSIIPLQPLIEAEEDPSFIEDFFPAFLLNSVDEEGNVWAIPFQRSTPVMYYNADLFAEAGIEKAPRNREELIAVAKQLTTPERNGVWLPSEGFPIWLFSAAAIANGQNLVDEDPCQVYFNTDAVKEGLAFWLSMSQEHSVMPKGLLSWGDTPTLFTSGSAAIAFHTTGSLTRILREAPFEVGVGFLPFGEGEEGYGVPVGGGNLYIFANSSEAEQQAAWEWVKFLSSPEIQADWGVRTGYVAARQSAWELEPLASLVSEKPQYAVARDQLAFAQKEFSAYRTIDLQGIINTTLSNIISGQESDIDSALATAQTQIDGLLAEVCQ
jgi:sn-glycerol 3-phosphate transport system substrate-binding protein